MRLRSPILTALTAVRVGYIQECGARRAGKRLMMLLCEARIARGPGLAWVGVAALLFQAIVFGWHGHSLPLSSPAHVAISAPSPASPLSPADLDNVCSICLTLHHSSSLPVEF